MDERRGEAFELDKQLTVIGGKLEVGAAAPDFELDSLNTIDGSLSQVRLSDSAGAVRILNVINSLDTPVCHVETQRWEHALGELPGEVCLYTVSMDLPWAQGRWRSAERVTHQALSAHRDEQFGRDYGVLIKEWRLLQRAVFVIDRDGRVAHAEYVADQMREPNYTAALDAARAAVGEAPDDKGA